MKPEQFVRMSLTVEGGVGLISFNRPERRNAWAGRSAVEYRWALHLCDVDPNVRVVVVTGVDDFCVGADSRLLGEIDARGGEYTVEKADLPDYPDGTPESLRHNHLYPLTLSVPVVAAIRGGCAGAGFLLATYADIRYVEVGCKIATSFAGLGLPAEYGTGWLLPRIVGIANAAQLLYSPKPITPERSVELGWAQVISPPGRVVDDAVEYAKSLAEGSSSQSLAMMKRAVFADSMGGLEDAYRRSVDDMNRALESTDFSVGVRALRDRHSPNFLEVIARE